MSSREKGDPTKSKRHNTHAHPHPYTYTPHTYFLPLLQHPEPLSHRPASPLTAGLSREAAAMRGSAAQALSLSSQEVSGSVAEVAWEVEQLRGALQGLKVRDGIYMCVCVTVDLLPTSTSLPL